MRLGSVVSAALAAFALLATNAGAAPAPASAAFLARTLDAHTTTLSAQHYALAAGPLLGEARANGAARIQVRLWAGQDYVFAAACEAACGVLTFRVVAPNGAVLAQDEGLGAMPVLRVRPAVTGRHSIEAAAPRCRAQSCWFAVNVYAR